MVPNAWQHPARIEPVRCLRLTLRWPLTLGHVLLLDELGSPVIAGEPIEPGELAVAVMVCSCATAAEARKNVRSWWAAPVLRWWGKWCWRLDHGEETERFAQWFSAQCVAPERKIRQGRGQEVWAHVAPWPIARLATAVGELGLSINEVCAMPLKQLNQLLGALDEARGQPYWSPREESFLAEIQKMDACL